uniref:Uncharacterized protein n=1 Tax=Moniliophthora roreri TaxID=221103 RepID=A0A0W0GFJ3_MONRR
MDICSIPSNADISGLGVRIATYMQACAAIAIIPVPVLHCHTIIPWKRLLSFASIFLDHFRIYPDRHSRRHLDRLLVEQVIPLLSPWESTFAGLRSSLVITSVSVLLAAVIQPHTKEGLTVYHGLITMNLALLNVLSLSYIACGEALLSLHRPYFWRKMTLLLLSHVAHAVLVGSFGLWFWSRQSRFEGYSVGLKCITKTLYWFFIPVNSHNTSLRKFFLAYNGFFVYLGLGLLVNVIILELLILPLMVLFFPLSFFVLMFYRSVDQEHAILVYQSIMAVPVVIGPLLLVFFFIYSTEQTIQLNRAALKGAGEESWSYGQMLAVVTATMSVGMLLGKILWKILPILPRIFDKWIKVLELKLAALPGMFNKVLVSTLARRVESNTSTSLHDNSAGFEYQRPVSAPFNMVFTCVRHEQALPGIELD